MFFIVAGYISFKGSNQNKFLVFLIYLAHYDVYYTEAMILFLLFAQLFFYFFPAGFKLLDLLFIIS